MWISIPFCKSIILFKIPCRLTQKVLNDFLLETYFSYRGLVWSWVWRKGTLYYMNFIATYYWKEKLRKQTEQILTVRVYIFSLRWPCYSCVTIFEKKPCKSVFRARKKILCYGAYISIYKFIFLSDENSTSPLF